MFVLSPQERNFISNIVEHEAVASVSYILRSLLSGVELETKDLYQLDDSLMDIINDAESEELEVPQFIDTLRDLLGRLISSGPSVASANPANPNAIPLWKPSPEKRPRKQKEKRGPVDLPSKSKKEKYNDIELTGDNVPQYLKDIHAIMMSVVEQRLTEEIEARKVAENKLKKLQEVLGI